MTFVSSDDVENELYGISPPLEYYLSIRGDVRLEAFFSSLSYNEDILVCKVQKYIKENDSFMCQIICFAERKHRWIDDLEVMVLLKTSNIPSSITLKVNSYIRGVFCDSNIDTKSLYISMLQEHVTLETSLDLTIITEDDFPLHYKLLHTKPVNWLDKYIGLSDKMIANQVLHLSKALEIDPSKTYSFFAQLDGLTCSPEKKISVVSMDYKSKSARFWLDQSKKLYKSKQFDRCSKALEKALEYEPNNVTILLNRVAFYMNHRQLDKALSDLLHIFSLDSDSVIIRAVEYITLICDKHRELSLSQDNYLLLSSCLSLLLKKLPDRKDLMKKTWFALVKFHTKDLVFHNDPPNTSENKNVVSEVSEDEDFFQGSKTPNSNNIASSSKILKDKQIEQEPQVLRRIRKRRRHHKCQRQSSSKKRLLSCVSVASSPISVKQNPKLKLTRSHSSKRSRHSPSPNLYEHSRRSSNHSISRKHYNRPSTFSHSINQQSTYFTETSHPSIRNRFQHHSRRSRSTRDYHRSHDRRCTSSFRDYIKQSPSS